MIEMSICFFREHFRIGRDRFEPVLEGQDMGGKLRCLEDILDDLSRVGGVVGDQCVAFLPGCWSGPLLLRLPEVLDIEREAAVSAGRFQPLVPLEGAEGDLFTAAQSVFGLFAHCGRL